MVNSEIRVGMKFGTFAQAIQQVKKVAQETKQSIREGGGTQNYYISTESGYATKKTNLNSLPVFAMYDTNMWSNPAHSETQFVAEYGDGFRRSGECKTPNQNNLSYFNNKTFSRIESDKYYAIDENKNGVVDKGEIFDKMTGKAI